ncbi:hypothetical protein [Spiribacter roseus]|uniref:hypothetical protein n=1 Tax=Spiribacter roseus TaxID=1855875 RepID=UPI0013304A24|nr:hypothetical protein [Spiribacter roseus]
MNKQDKENAEALVQLLLERTGFTRNLAAIIEAIEESLYGSTTKKDEGDFEETGDYREVKYSSPIHTPFKIYANSQPNKNIDAQFTDAEIEWLDMVSANGKFLIDTVRAPRLEHELMFHFDIPTYPNQATKDEIHILAKAPGVNLDSTSLDVEIEVLKCAEGVLPKSYTMYSLI